MGNSLYLTKLKFVKENILLFNKFCENRKIHPSRLSAEKKREVITNFCRHYNFRYGKSSGKKVRLSDDKRYELGLYFIEKNPYTFEEYCRTHRKSSDKDERQVVINFYGYFDNRTAGKKDFNVPSLNSSVFEREGFLHHNLHQVRLK